MLRETSRETFCAPALPILNRVESEFTDSRPVKTIKKDKYRFPCFIACSVDVTCIVTVIILENMFWNIKSVVFTSGGIEEGEFCCWACMFQMLNISLRKIFIYLFTLFKAGTIPVLTNKNHQQIKNIYIYKLNKIKHKC